jgi:uncharacterized alkaline shock family protein YloU
MMGVIRDALNTTDLTQGIAVEVGEDRVVVDVTLVAEYPVSLRGVADDVRAAIQKAMAELVGIQAAEVNVTVNDVHIPAEDEQETPVTDDVADAGTP